MKPLPSPLSVATLVVAVLVGACETAPPRRIEAATPLVADRIEVRVDAPWNRYLTGRGQDVPVWTLEGLNVDTLQFYVGVKDGAPIVKAAAGKSPSLVFRAGMQPAEIVAMFQTLWTGDGSQFTLERLEPAEFVGTPGLRFQYGFVRKRDDLRMRGVTWAAVRGGELFAINYAAPRLVFFDRHLAQVEALVRSARVRP